MATWIGIKRFITHTSLWKHYTINSRKENKVMKAIDYYGKYHDRLLNPETGLAEHLEVR